MKPSVVPPGDESSSAGFILTTNPSGLIANFAELAPGGIESVLESRWCPRQDLNLYDVTH